MLVSFTLMHQFEILGLISNDLAHFLVGKHGSPSLVIDCDETLILLYHVVRVDSIHRM